MPKTQKSKDVYVFIDTNIFLDSYRPGTELTVTMLERVKKVSDRVISTYQVQMEVLKKRQNILQRSHELIKEVNNPIIPAILADGPTNKLLAEDRKTTQKHIGSVKKQIIELLKDPQKNDRVLHVLDAIFSSGAEHVLTREQALSGEIEERAWKRFILGAPPRKDRDTSIGDALNWEWIVHCAGQIDGKTVIVSRDGDFGSVVDKEAYLNDYLLHEFHERVGPGCRIEYTPRLSDALERLGVTVTKEEVRAESDALMNLERDLDSKTITLSSDRQARSGPHIIVLDSGYRIPSTNDLGAMFLGEGQEEGK